MCGVALACIRPSGALAAGLGAARPAPTPDSGRGHRRPQRKGPMDRPQRALPPDYRALMQTYLAPQWPLVGLLAATLLTSIGLQLFIPQVLRRFIDTAIGGGAAATLTVIAALYLGAT